jgi:Putative bacterial sensory transduction regulator
MMSDSIITKLTLDSLRENVQLAGYRVETMTDPVVNTTYLHSATSGFVFDIRPGNRLADADQSFLDIAFIAALQVQGELPLDIVNRWNVTRRFGRLQLSQPFLILSLDVSVAGGVAQDHLRAQIEIWDHLLQQLISYLREELAKIAGMNGTAPRTVEAASTASEPEHGRKNEPIAPATFQ